MVQTTLQNAGAYACLNPRFALAFRALGELAGQPFEKGRHEVDGSRVYVVATEYDTKAPENCKMEAHRRYVDVMLLLEGEELIGVCPVGALREVTTPYDEKLEALLAAPEPGCSLLRMRPGDVAILFPEDAHAPAMRAQETAHVRKLIAKVAVD